MKIPPDRIWVVDSSGLTAGDVPGNMDELRMAIAKATGGEKQLEEIDQHKEVDLLIQGVVPREHWADAILPDVGSGNAKVGYIEPTVGINVEKCQVLPTDPRVRSAAEKEFGKVRDNFTRENLIAGAEILAGLATALQLEGKTLVFDRNGATAWLQALLDPSLTPPATSDVEATEVSPPAPVTRVAERTPAAEEAKAADPPQAPRATAPTPAREEPGRVYPSPQSAPAPQ